MSQVGVFEKFLGSVMQFVDCDVVSGKPIVTYTKTEIIVKVKPTVLRQVDNFQKCVQAFDSVGGEWMGLTNCSFSIKRVLPSVPVEVLLEVPVSDLVAGAQPRLSRNEETKQTIIRNIHERQSRGLTPFTDRLKTRPSSQFLGKHEVVDGYGRWQIALALGISMVPIIEREMSDSEAWEVAYIANDRDDLSDFERGRCFSDMLRQFPEDYPTQQSLADKLGVGRSRMAYLMAYYQKILLEKPNLPEEIVNRITNKPESIIRPALSAPAEIKKEVLTEFANTDFSQREAKTFMADIKEKVVAGTEPKQALEEVRSKRVSNEEALAGMQEDAAKDLKVEELKVAKLSKFYPGEMVSAAIAAQGWLSESKTVEVLAKGVASMWCRLTPEEQALLFKEAS